jgi:hypothetical protein
VSIGDWHTTRSLAEAGDAEATRFFGLKRECGIHGLEAEPAAREEVPVRHFPLFADLRGRRCSSSARDASPSARSTAARGAGDVIAVRRTSSRRGCGELNGADRPDARSTPGFDEVLPRRAVLAIAATSDRD